VAIYRRTARNGVHLRMLFTCFAFIWVVLFNRAAESPTYHLAATGLALWFVPPPLYRSKTYFLLAFLALDK
jgi:hypothetical protein